MRTRCGRPSSATASRSLGITGDAMGRPLIEALDDGGYDASSLAAVMSTAAVFSATVKEQFHDRFPNLVIVDAVGSTETGYNGMRVIMKGGKEKPGLPTVRMGPDTVVLDDDMNVVEPGSGVVGRMARRRQRAVALPQGSREVGRDVRDGRRPALCGVGRFRGRRSRRHDDPARARFGVHQLGRREDLPGRGRGRAQGAPRGVRRGRGGRSRRALGRAGRGRHRDPARSVGDARGARRAHGTLVAGYKVPRELHVVAKIERSPSGKPDYRWAKKIATTTPAE